MRNFKKIELCGCHYVQISDIAKENKCKLEIAELKLKILKFILIILN